MSVTGFILDLWRLYGLSWSLFVSVSCEYATHYQLFTITPLTCMKIESTAFYCMGLCGPSLPSHYNSSHCEQH